MEQSSQAVEGPLECWVRPHCYDCEAAFCMNLGKPWSVRLTEGLGGAFPYMQAGDPVYMELLFCSCRCPRERAAFRQAPPMGIPALRSRGNGPTA